MSRPDFKYFDFSQAEVLSKDVVRTISYLFENFARSVGTSLSAFLRFIVEITLESVEQVEYSDLLSEMPYPTCITIVGMKPLDSSAILELSLNFTFFAVDRLLGGSGEASVRPRALTEIEQPIVDRLVLKILSSLEETWAQVVAFDLSIDGRETNPQMAQIVSHNERIMLMKLKIRSGTIDGYIRIGIPAMALEPLKDRLVAHQWMSNEDQEEDSVDYQQIRRHLDDVQMPVTVRMGRVKLSLRSILELQPGQVIRLMSDEATPLPVIVRGKETFAGRIGVSGNNKAVKIVRICK